MRDDTALYAYAVVGSERSDDLGAGIDGEPLRLVTADDLAVVVHDHPAEPYSGNDDATRRRVLEHGAVVDRLWDADAALLPFAFDVLIRPPDAEGRLRGWLRDSAPALRRRMAAVAGRVELQIELALDPERTADGAEAVVAARADLAGRPPGVQRLLRRRLEQVERDLTEAVAERRYSGWRARIAALSAELAEPAPRRRDDGLVEVLRIAALVDRSATDRLGEALAAIQEEQPGVVVTYLGPWPPYSFADLGPLASAAGGTDSANGAATPRSGEQHAGMSDPRSDDQTDGEQPDQLPDGSGPVSHPDDSGDDDQFQG